MKLKIIVSDKLIGMVSHINSTTVLNINNQTDKEIILINNQFNIGDIFSDKIFTVIINDEKDIEDNTSYISADIKEYYYQNINSLTV